VERCTWRKLTFASRLIVLALGQAFLPWRSQWLAIEINTHLSANRDFERSITQTMASMLTSDYPHRWGFAPATPVVI
jgi:hypothetical protein